eukprot:SAG31_NODE_15319_length_760_cov_1.892587_1_plen_20_part_01
MDRFGFADDSQGASFAAEKV